MYDVFLTFFRFSLFQITLGKPFMNEYYTVLELDREGTRVAFSKVNKDC